MNTSSRHVVAVALAWGALAVACAPVFAADGGRLERVPLEHGLTAQRLVDAGLDVVEIHGGSCVLLVQDADTAVLAGLGARRVLIDEHPGLTAGRRTQAELMGRVPMPARAVLSAVRPDGVYRTEALPPFGSGSLGGFWTLAEVKMKLDDLVASDTRDLVSDKIDTLGTTLQGRPVWALEIARTWPGPGPDPRPVTYFNSLTHAREPEGMQSLFYWVDDLLAHYGTDPLATELLDHRRIVICPVVNPDGYKRNQDLFVSSGGTFGLWRKNLRDNNLNSVVDGNDGVDINRNYGYEWGLDSGSSGLFNSETYRGIMPFSEPETQIQRDELVALRPTTGLSFHTYGDWQLHPWGYTAAAPLDSAWFYRWDDDATRDNGYQSGQSTRVLYAVSGEFNDWAYGDTLLKPRMFSWTPEVGTDDDGFWPAPSRIVPLAAENLWRCYYTAAIAGPFVRVESTTLDPTDLNAGYFAKLAITATNIGLTTSGPELACTLASLSAGANVLQNRLTFPEAGPRSTVSPIDAGGAFTISADDTVTAGRALSFEVRFDWAAGGGSRDTIAIVCGKPTQVFFASATGGLDPDWQPAGWGIETSSDPAHLGPIFNDSPDGVYADNMDRALRLIPSFPLATAGVHGYLTFDTRWDFESKYDGATIELSADAATWSPIVSSGTRPSKGQSGSPIPVAGVPTIIGTLHRWRTDRVDLSALTGPTATPLYLRFRSVSDAFATFDGLSIDNVRVVVYDPVVQQHPVAVALAAPRVLAFGAPWPNPARHDARFDFTLPRDGHARLDVLDLQGRRVATLASGSFAAARYVRGWDLSDEAGRPVPTGVYLARLATESGVRTQRLVVMR